MAQVDYFLKIDGIAGESTDPQHTGELQLVSWGFGVDNKAPTSLGAGGAGKPVFSDFRFGKTTDSTSIPLFLACCSGQHFKTATLVCRKAGASMFEFLTISLTNVLVTSFDESGTIDKGGSPIDLVTLGYQTIQSRYVPQKPDGSAGPAIVGGWDLAANRKI